MTAHPSLASLPVPVGIEPMEARLVTALPGEPGWAFEPKWDGFRCLAYRAGRDVELRAKSGKPLGRYFPEVVSLMQELPVSPFVLDGELMVKTGRAFSFDALQMRVHPAESRIRRLAEATPATVILFDLLVDTDGKAYLDAPLSERRRALEALFAAAGANPALKLSPTTTDHRVAQGWLDHSGGALDGVVAKLLDGPYLPGERAMLKVKPHYTADCVVGGFRYGARSREVASLLLGLYDENGRLDHVGFTSGIKNSERASLTRMLEALEEPPGFTGNAPGGPSRWSSERSSQWVPLKPELVVEVSYDQVTAGRFRHGTTLIRWRPDKAPRQCTFAQIERPGSPELIAKLLKTKA